MSDYVYVPVLDEHGEDVGGYTESVPEVHVKEEPDCYACCDRGCKQCDPSMSSDAPSFIFTGEWPESGFGDEAPF